MMGFNPPLDDRPAIVKKCSEIMFEDKLFDGRTSDYDIVNDFFDDYGGWQVILMPNHDPQRLYFFNKLASDEPLVLWTYMKSDTKVLENF